MFSVQVAGFVFQVENRYGFIEQLCRKYRTQAGPGVPISVTEAEILREQTGGFSPEYLESVAVCRKIADWLIERDTILFHASALAMDGQACLFTAVSGYGKSTHARLWREQYGERVVMINDDKPFLRIADGGVTVFGSPWDGKHRLSTDTSAPLKALCILQRSPVNRLEPISGAQALPMLIQQAHRPSDPALLDKTLQLIDSMCRCVRFYRLWCNPEPEAARVAHAGIFKEEGLE